MKGTLVGSNRQALDDVFRRLGGTIVPVRRHGEIRYHHPSFPHPVKVNCRRKDTPRVLTKLVMRLAQRVD